MALDARALLKMSAKQLDDLFSQSPPGDIPNGEGRGTAIVAPGTVYSYELSRVVNFFAWQGKVFDAKEGVLRNEILPFGLRAIIAAVSRGASWLDGKDCIVLDYSKTSTVAHWIRDEIRYLGSGLYLGRVYWDKTPILHFCLEFS
ncbi:MAG TPA: hypothetical protein VFG53_04260 [Anaeromyxobacter sp.]|nr:hypothetical protein [Anaeromyxobacter sp.]